MAKLFSGKAVRRLFYMGRKGWTETGGQDLIEYALLAGFVALAAGAIMPNVITSVSTIFSKVSSLLTAAGTQGS